jgi:hypothetical protein
MYVCVCVFTYKSLLSSLSHIHLLLSDPSVSLAYIYTHTHTHTQGQDCRATEGGDGGLMFNGIALSPDKERLLVADLKVCVCVCVCVCVSVCVCIICVCVKNVL